MYWACIHGQQPNSWHYLKNLKVKLKFKKNDQVANCKSIMSLIVLGVTKGTVLDLMISGGDELEARDAIMELFNNRFGESE